MSKKFALQGDLEEEPISFTHNEETLAALPA